MEHGLGNSTHCISVRPFDFSNCTHCAKLRDKVLVPKETHTEVLGIKGYNVRTLLSGDSDTANPSVIEPLLNVNTGEMWVKNTLEP